MIDLTYVIPVKNHVQHLSQCLDQVRIVIHGLKATRVKILDEWSTDMTDFMLELETVPHEVERVDGFCWGEPLKLQEPSRLVVLVNPVVVYDPLTIVDLAEPVLKGEAKAVSPVIMDTTGLPVGLETPEGIPWSGLKPYHRHWDGLSRYSTARATEGLVVMTYDAAVTGQYIDVLVDMIQLARWVPRIEFQPWFELMPLPVQDYVGDLDVE